MKTSQLNLLLWKNYIIRKRQPGTLVLVFLWPVIVFGILYYVRANVKSDYSPTCQFPARSMPHDGLLPFVQSYICSIGNPCNPLSEYETIPSYKNASLGGLLVELDPMLENKTIISALKTVPKSIRLLTSMTQILTQPSIKKIFDNGIRVGDLINDNNDVRRSFKNQFTGVREDLIDQIFESSIKLNYLIGSVGSLDFEKILCNPNNLKKYLVLPKEDDYVELSKNLCSMDSRKIPDLLRYVSKHVDFNNFLNYVDRSMIQFRNYDLFLDLKTTIETILDLEIAKTYIPKYLHLRKWLPDVVLLLKNVTYKQENFSLINESIIILRPIFNKEPDWPTIQKTLLALDVLQERIKHIMKNPKSIDEADILKTFDSIFPVVSHGFQLFNSLLDRHEKDLPADAFAILKGMFSERIVNTVTYLVSMIEKIAGMLYHIAFLHGDVESRIYTILRNHPYFVQKVLDEVDPIYLTELAQSFWRLDIVETLIEEMEENDPIEILCQENMWKRIFKNVNDQTDQFNKTKNLLCSVTGKEFILDIQKSLELDDFALIMKETLSTFINVAFNQPIDIEKTNLITMTRAVKKFSHYLGTPKTKDPDWSIFRIDNKWTKVFQETKHKGRLIIFGIHLSIAKNIGIHSLSYITIRNDLKKLNILAKNILHDLRMEPVAWIDQVRQNKFRLIESFFLTLAEREKALKILEYSNFTKSHCIDSETPNLLKFPANANGTLLNELVCRLSEIVQSQLDLNITDVVANDQTLRFSAFNWTNFNENLIDIYEYIVNLVYDESDIYYDLTQLKEYQSKFQRSWKVDVTARNAFEIGVGVICKMLGLIESPLFNVPSFKKPYAIGWASSVVLQNIEQVIDKIQGNKNNEKLFEILLDLRLTEELIEVFFTNLSSIVLDLIEIITLKKTNLFISSIEEYRSRESKWPCVERESIGLILELRNPSRAFIREIERIACNPGPFMEEWKQHPVFVRVQKIFKDENNVDMPKFNWTLGYIKFRRFAEKFDILVKNVEEEIQKENDKSSIQEMEVNDIENIHISTEVEHSVETLFDYFDLQINKIFQILRSNLTTSQIWKSDLDMKNRILILGKFVSFVVHKVGLTTMDTLKNINHDNGTETMNLLTVLGFNEQTFFSIFHNGLTNILNTLINGLSNPIVENQIVQSLNRNNLSCHQIFDWLSYYSTGFDRKKYNVLESFICDLDVNHFNAYTQLYTTISATWFKPVNEYRSYMVSLVSDTYNVAKIIDERSKQNLSIELPFSTNYFHHVMIELRDTLNLTYQESQNHTDLPRPNTEWSNYRLIIESISEIILNVARTLQRLKSHENELHLWDLFENENVKELVKLFDTHPEETIALLATVLTINSTTGGIPLFKETWKFACDLPSRTEYWSQSNRKVFADKLCTFDTTSLLKSVTSDEFFNAITDRKSPLPKSTSLMYAMLKLLNTISDNSNYTMRSNLFNSSTWTNISRDTWSAIYVAEKSIIRDLSTKDDISWTKITKMSQVLGSTIDLILGGDSWVKLKRIFQTSRFKFVLDFFESAPSIVVTAVENYFNSDKLTDYTEKLFLGTIHICEIKDYFIQSDLVREKNLVNNIDQFCRNIVNGSQPLTNSDVIPFDIQHEERQIYNETYVMEVVNDFQLTLIEAFSKGVTNPEPPKWWISFEKGTWEDFLTSYRSKNPREIARTVARKLTKFIKNLIESKFPDYRKCSWCASFDTVMYIFNFQLSQHRLYGDFLCQINKQNVSILRDKLINDLHWDQTKNMLKNYEVLKNERSEIHFMKGFQNILVHVADIIIDHRANSTYNEMVAKCFHTVYSSPGTYIYMLIGILEVLQKNIHIFNDLGSREDLDTLTRLAANYIPIWKPLNQVVLETEVETIEKLLPNGTINVNRILNDHRSQGLCHTRQDCRNATFLNQILNTEASKKYLQFDSIAANYSSPLKISQHLARSLNLDYIEKYQVAWRKDKGKDFIWLKEIIKHVIMVLEESGSLFNVISKIDFQDISNILGAPDLVDGIINLVQDHTVDKLFVGMREILEDVKPFLNDTTIINDLGNIIRALEMMDVWKNMDLVDIKYPVKNMFDDWDSVMSYLIEKIPLSSKMGWILGESKLDMITIFIKELKIGGFKNTLCSPEKLDKMLDFNRVETTVDEVSHILCKLDDSQMTNITITLVKNLNFNYIFDTLMGASVKNIVFNANLTESDVRVIMKNLRVSLELLPFFQSKLSGPTMPMDVVENQSDSSQGVQSSAEFLQTASTMLCGKPLISDRSAFYRIISSIQDNNKDDDQEELDSLPTDFCRNAYKSLIAVGGGKIIWTYVKPLLRGQILYSPNTNTVNQIMRLSNETFIRMDRFSDMMNSFKMSLLALNGLSQVGDQLESLNEIMSSNAMRDIIKSFGNAGVDNNSMGSFSQFKLQKKDVQFQGSEKLIEMIGSLSNLMECVLIDRIKGYPTEEELEIAAGSLAQTKEFLAGVVFPDEQYSRSNRFERSTKVIIPDNMIYKIRMDVDYAPTTKRLKNQFWLPGPEGSFIENLRYLRGFIQIQDSIDRAIIKLKTHSDHKWKTLTQQMPYPCWEYSPFHTTLYETQCLQICFFFALMMCVGASSRYLIWERESRNAMLMSVMGLKPWKNTLAWFVTTFIEMTVVMFGIAAILLIGTIFPHSNALLVMFFFLVYVFSIVTFCYMISSLFDSASLAAITNVVLFLVTYVPYITVITMDAAMTLTQKLLICCNMSTAFCYGCLFAIRKEVQGIGLQWDSIWTETSPGDSMCLGWVLLMMTLDGCVYAMIGYLINRYTDSEGKSSFDHLKVNKQSIGVKLDTLRKVFPSNRGDVVAVDNVTLELSEGQVTSLLGRNGAGKTTIIKMLTGMLTPTSGEIILSGEDGLRPDVGICPQENVLIDSMTAREHMIFYMKLKKYVDNDIAGKNVDAMMVSLELGYQENEPVSRLSGGTRRRLCVALAFLGSPRLVILDEPGAGVDPAARRRIWRLIDQHRIGRTVLLSTHHLDEADMLSDTVVIMHKGKILCTGSPVSLKTTHGQGYKLNILFSSVDEDVIKTLESLIHEVEEKAILKSITESEIVITLPSKKQHGFDNESVTNVVKTLEDNRKLLGYSHISLECDTLEKVFVDLCERADSKSSTITSNGSETKSNDNIDYSRIVVESTSNPSALRQSRALMMKRLWHFSKNWKAQLTAFVLPTIFFSFAMGFSLVRESTKDEPPLILKPEQYGVHSTQFYSIQNQDDSFLQKVFFQLENRFNKGPESSELVSPNVTRNCECSKGQQICEVLSEPKEGLVQTLSGQPTLEWITSTHQEYIERRYGGWSLQRSNTADNPLYLVWYNNKGWHSLPAYLNALNEAILRSFDAKAHLTTINHPIKLSTDQLNRTVILQHVADVGIALILLVAFSLVGAGGAKELVRERLTEEKRIMYLAGVHPLIYWITALIWDYLIFVFSILMAVVVFKIFGLSAYVEKDNLLGICVLLILFAWAIIPFIHLAEKLFDDSTLSYITLFCVNAFIGIACLTTILVFDILGESQITEDIRNALHRVLMIFPQYVLADGLIEMVKNDIKAELMLRFNVDTYLSPLGWDLLGRHFTFLFIFGGIFLTINLMVECRLIFYKKPRNNTKYENLEENEDVTRERTRVEDNYMFGSDPDPEKDVLKTLKLRKVYRNAYNEGNVAVKNLSFGVQPGKCFGILGVNGAGKSTTFKMLTTEIVPTAGKIILKGQEVGLGPLCDGNVSYCPQSDALDGFLTPYQCLTIHAEISGLRNVPQIVEISLRRFDLDKYAHRRVDRLSGGNKRKLCAAMSVMSPVSLVLMDEPTSGMDPTTKNLVSKGIQLVTKNQSCVILTSHSVADCESLCDRVGILAKAGLRCIGTPQQLKHKYGKGYVAFLRFGQPVATEDLKNAISKYLPQAILSSRQASAARILIPRNDDHSALSTSLTQLKFLAEKLQAVDYALTQSSLDQVLVNFSEELEYESIDVSFNSGQSDRLSYPNMYSSSDVIVMDTL